MSSTTERCTDHPRLLALIEFALREGWNVSRTPSGQLKLMKPGLPPIFTRSPASILRPSQNK